METKYAIKIKFYLRTDVTCCTNSSFLEYEMIFFSHCTGWQLVTRDTLLKLFFSFCFISCLCNFGWQKAGAHPSCHRIREHPGQVASLSVRITS